MTKMNAVFVTFVMMNKIDREAFFFYLRSKFKHEEHHALLHCHETHSLPANILHNLEVSFAMLASN